MAVEPAVSSGSVPALVVRTAASDRTLRLGRSYKVGRDPQADIAIDDPRVSWHTQLSARRALGYALCGQQLRVNVALEPLLSRWS